MRGQHDSTQDAEKAPLGNETLLRVRKQDRPRAYLTVTELSEELGISSRTAYYLIAKGEIPHVRVGRSIRIYRDTLEEWRRGQEEASKKKGPVPAQVEAFDPSEGSTHAILQA